MKRVCLAAVALMWVLYFTAGKTVARQLGVYFGAAMLRAMQGKINDPVFFIHRRLFEMVWLSTATFLIVGASFLLAKKFTARRRVRPWIWQALIGFVAINVWVGLAARSCLFWLAMWDQGEPISTNLVQFQIKRILHREHAGRLRAVLLGSSQARAQINEEMLNEQLGDKLWTTELHFPGSKAYDIELVARCMDGEADYVICYLSEGNFYTGAAGECVPYFLSFSHMPDLIRLGGIRVVPSRDWICGLLGQILPLFRYRGVIAQRILGGGVAELPQAIYNATQTANLETRAKEAAVGFQQSSASEFGKKAFDRFAAHCNAQGQRLIICAGQLNPLLEEQLPPQMHTDFAQYLEALAVRYPRMTLLRAGELPLQMPTNYDDLTHVNKKAQQRFTEFLAQRLIEMIDSGE